MSFVDKFERGFLFSLTRFVALFFIGMALLGLIGSIVISASSLIPKSTTLSQEEIVAIANPAEKPENTRGSLETNLNSAPDSLASIKLPFIVQKHFSDPENLILLKDWLSNLTFAQKNNFIEELAKVIKIAEDNKKDPIEAINSYKIYKLQLILDQKLEQSQNYYKNAMTFGVIAATIITIALFSLVLVLLAIERNTRKIDV